MSALEKLSQRARELPAGEDGPIGALGVPITGGRSIAIDPRSIPLGAPVRSDTLERTMLLLDDQPGFSVRPVLRPGAQFGETVANLVQNTQAAESVIRDADMAYEMTVFTKNQILTQSAQSMLGQANQLPSAVLNVIWMMIGLVALWRIRSSSTSAT